VLERVVAALREADVEQVLAVVGPHVPELAPLAAGAGAHVLQLAEETPDMRATVEAGLRWLEERFRPRPDDYWLLVPADHPALDPIIVRMLLWARAEARAQSIVVPTHGGRRGHPTVIDWKHVAGMRSLPPGAGLNAYLRQHVTDTLEVRINSADVLRDLDTPEDYERLRQSLARAAAEDGTFRLFVYGSLMRGGLRHVLLRNQRFLREAVTRPKYLLYNLGAYPGLVVAEKDGRAIHGELYEVERRLIPQLDMIEGAPDHYWLQPLEIEDETAPIYGYICRSAVAGLPLCDGGRWRPAR
jgi:molybdenum cofactor cytidylyltransferase